MDRIIAQLLGMHDMLHPKIMNERHGSLNITVYGYSFFIQYQTLWLICTIDYLIEACILERLCNTNMQYNIRNAYVLDSIGYNINANNEEVKFISCISNNFEPLFWFLVVCVVSCSILCFRFGVLCLVCRNFFYGDVAEEEDANFCIIVSTALYIFSGSSVICQADLVLSCRI